VSHKFRPFSTRRDFFNSHAIYHQLAEQMAGD
jgi:hypothetical protein